VTKDTSRSGKSGRLGHKSLQGGQDVTVDPFLAEELLRRLGKEAEYARYDGEGHSPLYWSYANQVDFCNRVIAWFDMYLKAVPKH